MKKGVARIACKKIYKDVISLCMTEDLAENVLCNIPKSNIKPYIIDCGIDFSGLSVYSEETYINNENYFNMLIIGVYKHKYRKGVALAAKALESLVMSTDMNIRLYLISDNKEEGEIFVRQYVSNEVADYYITIVPPRPDISSYYKRAHVFRSPSREEGLTYAIPEASYCGCEIIATKCVGQRNNKTKDIYWVDDSSSNNSDFIINQLAQQIKVLYKKWEQGESITKEKLIERKTYLEDVYSMDKWCDSVIDVLKSV